MDVGQDESGNKTIGITFPGNLVTPNIQPGNSLAQSNRNCWNQFKGHHSCWVTPLRIFITLLSLLITFILMYYLVRWGNRNL